MEKPVSLKAEHIRDEKVKVCLFAFNFLWKDKGNCINIINQKMEKQIQ